MSIHQSNKVYPCPFSKHYSIPIEQAWSLLKIFFIYRFIVSCLFVILFFSKINLSSLGGHDAVLYRYASQCYFSFTVLSGVCVFWRSIKYNIQAQLTLFSEIFFITLLMHASGGLNSGLGILLIVSITAGGLLIGGRCALLFAALASLSILTEQLYVIQTHAFSTTSFTYAGMLGVAFFTTTYLSYILAKWTEQSEVLVSQQQQTILNLEELNRSIIQQLQSGIIISNSQQQIKMCNEAALKITENPTTPLYLTDISEQLSYFFQRWMDDYSQNIATLILFNLAEIHLRFSSLKTQHETFHMIFLEDISIYNQRLQQSKLASLGHLTASIAHEIRNPLGAISHAGQLLCEIPDLSPEDQRLTEIIDVHCQRINKIIEDVLQLSRRSASKRKKINLNPWLHNYLQNFIEDTACHSKYFEINEKKTAVWIFIDPDHLKQILDNLCTNALKYGNSKVGKIILELNVMDNIPQIKVIDNGHKIDIQTIQHLFEPFFTTSSTGTGLGLYISKELAELNQASLSYTTTKENKSCFKLCLPNANNALIKI